MVSRVRQWASIGILASVFVAGSCGGQECRCAENDDRQATSGAESDAPIDSSAAPTESLEAPASNPYAAQTSAAATKEAELAPASAEKPSKADWKDLVRRGQRRFDKACGNCHPDGEEDLGPSLIGIRWTVPRMTRQIRNGSGKMKPISTKRLPQSEMEPLMAYLSTLRAVKGVSQP